MDRQMRRGDPKSTNRVLGKNPHEILPNCIHCGPNRRFEESCHLLPTTGKDVSANKQEVELVDHPVSINFPALIPWLRSLSLIEPNLTYCDPVLSENTLFKPSSNFSAKAAISSGVLNFDCFNVSGCGSTGGQRTRQIRTHRRPSPSPSL